MIHTFMSVVGGHTGCNTVARTIADSFNVYTNATASFIEFPNPYQENPYIKIMEGNGLTYAATLMKFGIIKKTMDQYKSEERLSNIVITTNYIDDALMSFVMNEIIRISKDGEFNSDSSKELLDDTISIVNIAKDRYGLRLSNEVIPFNDSNEPTKVIYPPVAMDITMEAIKGSCIYEISDYIFPEQPIQSVLYYAFTLYNRYVNTIAFAGMPTMYTLNGDSFISNLFGTTSPETMTMFEGYIPEGCRINYKGRSYFDPLHTSEIKPNEEDSSEKVDNDINDESTIDMSDSSEDIPVNDIPGDDFEESEEGGE